MPITRVAIAEIVLAAALAIWLTVQNGIEEPVLYAWGVFGLAALNAGGILRFAPQGAEGWERAGFWLIAAGGFFLLLIASNGLWSEWVIPPATSFVELLAPLDQLIRIGTWLASLALLCLLAGWTMMLAARRDR